MRYSTSLLVSAVLLLGASAFSSDAGSAGDAGTQIRDALPEALPEAIRPNLRDADAEPAWKGVHHIKRDAEPFKRGRHIKREAHIRDADAEPVWKEAHHIKRDAHIRDADAEPGLKEAHRLKRGRDIKRDARIH